MPFSHVNQNLGSISFVYQTIGIAENVSPGKSPIQTSDRNRSKFSYQRIILKLLSQIFGKAILILASVHEAFVSLKKKSKNIKIFILMVASTRSCILFRFLFRKQIQFRNFKHDFQSVNRIFILQT